MDATAHGLSYGCVGTTGVPLTPQAASSAASLPLPPPPQAGQPQQLPDDKERFKKLCAILPPKSWLTDAVMATYLQIFPVTPFNIDWLDSDGLPAKDTVTLEPLMLVWCNRVVHTILQAFKVQTPPMYEPQPARSSNYTLAATNWLNSEIALIFDQPRISAVSLLPAETHPMMRLAWALFTDWAKECLAQSTNVLMRYSSDVNYFPRDNLTAFRHASQGRPVHTIRPIAFGQPEPSSEGFG